MTSRVALITFLDGGPVDPGYGVPSLPGYSGGHPSTGPVFPGGPVDPGYGHPIYGGRPDQGLPPSGGHPWFPGHLGGPKPDQGLPVYPGRPVQLPVFPSDPDVPPPTASQPIYIEEGRRFEVKWSAHYGWILVPVDDTAQPK